MKLGTKKKKKKKATPEDFDTSDIPKLRGDYPLVSVDDLFPNDWNPNVMPKEAMKKLKVNIQDTVEATGTIPPVVTRNHPDKEGQYEIIDGYHRTEVMKQIGYKQVPFCNMGDVSKVRAMKLTETLNHLRGENDPVKYVEFLDTMIKEGESLVELEKFLPDTVDDMQTLLESNNIRLDDVSISGGKLDDVEEDDEEQDENTWVELKFKVAKPQAEIIEAEIGRIASILNGGNIRGRALEFMAVSSADTPLKSITGGDEEEPRLKKKMKLLGKKKKKKHRREESVELGEAD